MATVKCALGKRGRPSHEWNDGEKDRIYCLGWIAPMTDDPLPECMDEYIKREAVIAIIEEKQKELCPVGRYGRGYVYGSDREKYDAWDEIIDALENIPAANVAPVVRCMDCKHLVAVNVNGKGIPTCRVSGMEVAPDDFCSHGEPKEGDHADDHD